MTASFSTLQELIASFAERGGNTALIGFKKDGSQSYSFQELAELIQRLARGLLNAGLEPGSRVLLFAPNQVEWIITCLALVSARAVPVPVDIQIGREELQHILRQCEAHWACTTPTLAPRLEGTEIRLKPILLDGEAHEPGSWRSYLAASSGNSLPSSSSNDSAVLFYTSGTSGQPKGVPLTHNNLMSNVNALLDLGLIRPDYRVLLPLPLHHVYPFTIGMLAPLAAGAPIILPSGLTGKEFLRALQEGGATAVIGVPRLYGAFYEAIDSSFRKRSRIASGIFHGMLAASIELRRRFGLRAGDYGFAPLRRRIARDLHVLASGGSAMEPDLAWKLEGLGWQIASGYGLTETSPLLTFNAPGKERIGTAGRPIPGVELRISQPEEERQFGEVLARGPNVFSGYWQMAKETAEAFTPDGYFRTGDLGYMDEEGYLHLVGRASSMIVLSGGENIQPEKVEAALEQSPYIREAGVVARKDRLAALVIPEAEAQRQSEPIGDLILREVRRQSSNLPSHHRVTDYAISQEPLPRTRIGKIRRHVLAERFDRAKSDKEKEAAAGPVPIEQMSPEDQELLEDPAAKAIWDWLPGRYPEARLAPEMNLQLELGIDSLDWLHLTMEIRALTGAELDEAAIGRIESVRDLLRETAAARLATSAQGDDPLERLKTPKELISREQRRWLEPRPLPVRLLGFCLLALNRALMRTLFRLRVRDRNHLPDKGPFILAPNHTSFLDPLAIGAALPQAILERTYWGGWTAIMFANPLMRLLSRAVRVIPIDPKGGPLSSVAFAVAALKEEYSLTWFPEGGRSPDGRLASFRPGIGLLASAAPVPLVPVWIDGAHEALPWGSRMPRLRTITVTFGEPIDPRELQGSYQAIADALHERVTKLAGGAKET